MLIPPNRVRLEVRAVGKRVSGEAVAEHEGRPVVLAGGNAETVPLLEECLYDCIEATAEGLGLDFDAYVRRQHDLYRGKEPRR